MAKGKAVSFAGYFKLDETSSSDVLSALERAQVRSIRMRDANLLIAKWGQLSSRPALEQLGLARDEIVRLTGNPVRLGYTIQELLAADASVRRLTALLVSATSGVTRLVPLEAGSVEEASARRRASATPR